MPLWGTAPAEAARGGTCGGSTRTGSLSPVYVIREGPIRIYDFSLLRSFRIREGLTQQELADAVGASRATVSRIERGCALPSVSLALALARRLEATVEELFAPDDLR